MIDLQGIEQAARESGDWRAAFGQVKAEVERLHTDLIGAREFHAAASQTVGRVTEDNERLRTALDEANNLIFAAGAPLGTPNYFAVRKVLCEGLYPHLATPTHILGGPAAAPSATRALSAADVIARLCKLTEEVHGQLGYGHASDCFCGEGGFWGSGSYDGTHDRGYRNDGHCLGFIEQIVRDGLAQMRKPQALEPKPALGAVALVRDMLADKDAEIERLRALLNTPETANFLEGVKLEAAHQRERWGAPHDREKSAEHWYWLVGYLGGKALRSAIAGDKEKAQHHTISSAAALSHWHAAIAQDTSGSGIGQDADLEAHDNGLSGEIHGQG